MTWDGFLEGFHAKQPRITEPVLRHVRADATDPYAWVGLDKSATELAAARLAGARSLLRARGAMIPLRNASIDVVICSMSLIVTTQLPRVIAEIIRVLRPGGLLAATVPAGICSRLTESPSLA